MEDLSRMIYLSMVASRKFRQQSLVCVAIHFMVGEGWDLHENIRLISLTPVFKPLSEPMPPFSKVFPSSDRRQMNCQHILTSLLGE